MRRTKIIATLGPSSEREETLWALAEEGVDIFRINTAHGTPEDHRRWVRQVRKTGRPLGVLLDTRGPKIRVAELVEPLSLSPGDEVVLGKDIPITHPEVFPAIPVGARVLLADGALEFQVVAKSEKGLISRALRAGLVQSGKGLNFPGISLPLPALSPEDRESLNLAKEEGVDFVALSFVQRPEDVAEARAILGKEGPWVLVKVELAEAVRRMNELVAVADGAMVARGDLGVEIEPYQVPLVQRKLVDLCNAWAKPVIVATQMLKSMVDSPFPTRAEVADIANAVWDGADALMLSEETAIGKYPVEAVRVMAKAASAAEEGEVNIRVPGLAPELVGEVPAAIAQAACSIAQEVRAKLIVCATFSGWTARLLSSFRPRIPILAVTPRLDTLRKLSLVWGVTPVLIPEAEDIDTLFEMAREASLALGLLNRGERFVFTAGLPFHQAGTTNLIRVAEA